MTTAPARARRPATFMETLGAAPGNGEMGEELGYEGEDGEPVPAGGDGTKPVPTGGTGAVGYCEAMDGKPPVG